MDELKNTALHWIARIRGGFVPGFINALNMTLQKSLSSMVIEEEQNKVQSSRSVIGMAYLVTKTGNTVKYSSLHLALSIDATDKVTATFTSWLHFIQALTTLALSTFLIKSLKSLNWTLPSYNTTSQLQLEKALQSNHLVQDTVPRPYIAQLPFKISTLHRSQINTYQTTWLQRSVAAPIAKHRETRSVSRPLK
jgi:hypothetical protein